VLAEFSYAPRVCRVCNTEKPVEEFGLVGGKFGTSRHRVCIPCQRYLAKKSTQRKQAENLKRYGNVRSPSSQEKRQMFNRARRIEAISLFGGKCECCGETRIEFLTFDHKNGRKGDTATSQSLVKKILAAGYPNDEYRVLCWNCNCAIGVYGYCPHENERKQKWHS